MSASGFGSVFPCVSPPPFLLFLLCACPGPDVVCDVDRWRQPALSMHTISVVTGSSSKTLISGSVSATISVRIVPDQEMDVIRASIQRYLEEKFAEFGSRNQLSVRLLFCSFPVVPACLR